MSDERFADAPFEGSLLEVTDVKTAFETDRGLVRSVDGVSLTLEPGDQVRCVFVNRSGPAPSTTTTTVPSTTSTVPSTSTTRASTTSTTRASTTTTRKTTTTTRPSTTTTRKTTTTRPTTTTNPICQYKNQIPTWLWNLIEQIFGVKCP